LVDWNVVLGEINFTVVNTQLTHLSTILCNNVKLKVLPIFTNLDPYFVTNFTPHKPVID